MTSHPFADVVIAGVANTVQARRIDGATAHGLCVESILGACSDAGIDAADIDGLIGPGSGAVAYDMGIGPVHRQFNSLGIPGIANAAALISTGQASVVAVYSAGAGVLPTDERAASWTRPENELVAGYGLFTAAEMALMARAHMERYGTTREQMAHVAAVVRNNGSAHPDAVYSGRGPFTAEDVMRSPLVADPFCLLDCATTSEGGCALVLAHADRAQDLATAPAWIHGTASDAVASAYTQAPSFDLSRAGGPEFSAGWVGRRAAQLAFAQAGLTTDDVDVCEFYDPFSFELIRQFEAFGFCAEGEGGPFVTSGAVEPGGRFPVTTDGGTMSFSHAGINAQQLQRVIRGVQQVRGTCVSMQVAGAEVAMCTNGGSGALFTDVMLVGRVRP